MKFVIPPISVRQPAFGIWDLVAVILILGVLIFLAETSLRVGSSSPRIADDADHPRPLEPPRIRRANILADVNRATALLGLDHLVADLLGGPLAHAENVREAGLLQRPMVASLIMPRSATMHTWATPKRLRGAHGHRFPAVGRYFVPTSPRPPADLRLQKPLFGNICQLG